MSNAHERLDAARRAAEDELKRDNKPLENSEDVLECVPAFAKFARALFRSVKDKLLAAIDWEAAWLAGEAASTERFDAVLEALLAHTIEEGLSEATLAAQRASGAAGASSPTPRPPGPPAAPPTGHTAPSAATRSARARPRTHGCARY